MTEWIYFIHPPRDDFAATMTADEKSVWSEHFDRLQRMLAAGQLILAGPTLGRVNTGIAVFEAPDEETMAKAAIMLASRGTMRTTTLPAIPVDQLIARLKADG